MKENSCEEGSCYGHEPRLKLPSEISFHSCERKTLDGKPVFEAMQLQTRWLQEAVRKEQAAVQLCVRLVEIPLLAHIALLVE